MSDKNQRDVTQRGKEPVNWSSPDVSDSDQDQNDIRNQDSGQKNRKKVKTDTILEDKKIKTRKILSLKPEDTNQRREHDIFISDYDGFRRFREYYEPRKDSLDPPRPIKYQASKFHQDVLHFYFNGNQRASNLATVYPLYGLLVRQDGQTIFDLINEAAIKTSSMEQKPGRDFSVLCTESFQKDLEAVLGEKKVLS